MSAIESTSEEKCKSVESASVTAEIMVVESGESSEFLITDDNKQFITVLESSYSIMMAIEGYISKRQEKKIRAIKSKMDKLYRDIIILENTNIDNLVLLAQAYLYLSRIYIESKYDLELNIADSHINKCINLLEGKETERKVILTAVHAYYFLGFLYRAWNKHEQSLIALQKALQLYLAYNDDEKEYLAPINIFPVISVELLNSEYALEQRCVFSLRDLLIGIKSTKTDDKDKTNQTIIDNVIACKRKLLNRMLNSTLPDEDCIQWTSQTTFLVQILLKFGRFTAARDHLAAASFLMKIYYQNKSIQMNEQTQLTEKTSIFDMYKEVMSNIDWLWAKYGLKLLQLSQEKLCDVQKNKPCGACMFQSTVKQFKNQSNESLEFTDIILSEFTVKITDNYLSCYADAKKVFTTVLVHCKKAVEYFTLENHFLEYINIMQDIAYAYKYLANYESNTIKQVKLYKRQLQILINITDVLDGENDIDILKPIWIEIAITNSNILDKYTGTLRYNNDALNTGLIEESDMLIEQIFNYWKLYIQFSSQITY